MYYINSEYGLKFMVKQTRNRRNDLFNYIIQSRIISDLQLILSIDAKNSICIELPLAFINNGFTYIFCNVRSDYIDHATQIKLIDSKGDSFYNTKIGYPEGNKSVYFNANIIEEIHRLVSSKFFLESEAKKVIYKTNQYNINTYQSSNNYNTDCVDLIKNYSIHVAFLREINIKNHKIKVNKMYKI